jgi:hypothetical protein
MRGRGSGPKVLLWANELPEQQSSAHGPVGDEGQQIWMGWAILAYDADTLVVRTR